MSEASLVSASSPQQPSKLTSSLALIKYISPISPILTNPSSLNSDSPTSDRDEADKSYSDSPISSMGSNHSSPTKDTGALDEYAASLAIVSLLERIKVVHQKGVGTVHGIQPLTAGYESMKSTLLQHLEATVCRIDRELRIFRGLSQHLTPAEAEEEATIRRWELEAMEREVTTLVGVFGNHGGTEDEWILDEFRQTVETLMDGRKSEPRMVIPA